MLFKFVSLYDIGWRDLYDKYNFIFCLRVYFSLLMVCWSSKILWRKEEFLSVEEINKIIYVFFSNDKYFDSGMMFLGKYNLNIMYVEMW